VLAEALSFDPPLDSAARLRWRETATWMAPHAKFFALYERPFWRAAGLSGAAQSMVGPMAEIHDATSASGTAALFGFLGIAAEQRRAVGEAAIVEACVAQLRRLFGPPAASPLATLFMDWSADPLTATAADRTATEHPLPGRVRWIDGAWADRLSLAASETSDTEPGFLAGAAQAAERAVAERLRALRARAAPPVLGTSAMTPAGGAMHATTPATTASAGTAPPTSRPATLVAARGETL
jgi:monoamine oxidase